MITTDKELIKDFTRQLKRQYKEGFPYNVIFLAQKEGDMFTVESYNCWGIISKLGPEKFNSWRKVAEQALINIREIYPGKEIML